MSKTKEQLSGNFTKKEHLAKIGVGGVVGAGILAAGAPLVAAVVAGTLVGGTCVGLWKLLRKHK